MAQTYVNQSMRRVDAGLKVTGAAEYSGDLKLKGMLQAAVLRSPHAHARITSIDVSAAAAMPGVKAVVTGQDFPNLMGTNFKDQPFFAVDRVRFWGEPVAAVAAVDADTAEFARSLIRVEYEPLPVLLDAQVAQGSTTLLHPRLTEYDREKHWHPIAGTNIVHHHKVRKGDIAKGFAAADRIISGTYSTPMQQHVPMETRSAVAQAGADGGLTLWVSTQSPFVTRKMLAESLGMPLNMIRVIVPWVGGGFGEKVYITFEAVVAALALKARGAPVRLMLDREEEFLTTVRHGVTLSIKAGLKADGTIVAWQAEATLDTGAYADCGPRVGDKIALHLSGPYNAPNVHVDTYTVYTNKVPATAFRGYGVPQAVWAHECHMDVIAAELGLDRADLRRRNLLRDGDETCTGQRLVAVAVTETMEAVLASLRPQDRTQPSRPGLLRGKGFAVSHKSTSSPSSSGAMISYHSDGTVTVLTGLVDMGQGVNTVIVQIVADELGVPAERIAVLQPDTQVSPLDRSTSASRGTFMGGNAMRLAAADLVAQFKRLAGELWEVDPHDVEYVDGNLQVKGYPGKSLPADQMVRQRLGAFGGALIGRADFFVDGNRHIDHETSQGTEASFWMYGTHGAEVEVDTETGLVRVVRLVAAHDVGKAINPVACHQQIEGGALMGIGGALTEELHFDPQGRLINPTLVDYKLQTTADLPDVESILIEVPHPDGPHGAKGLGEPALTPTAAAIANAVCDAIGVRIRDLPITPERVLQALAAVGRGG